MQLAASPQMLPPILPPSLHPASCPAVLAEHLLLRGHLLGTVDTGKQDRVLVKLVFPWPTECHPSFNVH